MSKFLIPLALIAMIALGWFVINQNDDSLVEPAVIEKVTETEVNETTDVKTVVTNGSYVVDITNSKVEWAGKKPLIEGYINTGSFGLLSGAINVVDDIATGTFTIDMKTLSVSKTPTKPGKESTLEEHLMSDRWFDVEAFPEASFMITEVTKRADSDTTLTYDVRGDLTLKGQTHEVTFPANIYLDSNDRLNAVANFEFDRTKWGITSGSGSFFDDLADNVIDDMVKLSFHLIADKQ